ncbi:type VII secretion integral membrane protein EccD [Mycobacterium basiliense]|uniref:type VII secretion integral membrane protein EccD n=1 Tax=Mycobacterium basiliense TaxID=2094119 RepID=UPI001301856A|nr:type VII secretion integral membrane protein EccD [Mycobacterium basiliense]
MFADPGLRRVTVHAGTTVVDLSLPAAVPVSSLIPAIVDILGNAGDVSPGPTAQRYQLSCPAVGALPASTTLSDSDIRDGAVLALSRCAPDTAPRYLRHDEAEAVSEALNEPMPPQHRCHPRLTGALVACGLAAAGALVVFTTTVHDEAPHSDGTVCVAAAGGVALLLAAVAQRIYRDPMAALTLSAIAITFAALAGLLVLPGAAGLPNLLLAAMATAATAVLAIRVSGCGVVPFTAVACCALVVAIATLAGVIGSAPAYVVGSSAALASLGLLQLSTRIAIVLAGLSPRLPALDSDEVDAAPTTDSLAAKAIRSRDWLTGMQAAFSSSATIGALLATLTSRRGIAVAVVAGAVLLLSARSTADGRGKLVYVVSGSVTIAATFAAASVRLQVPEPWIATLVATSVAAAMYLAFVAPAVPISPLARRGIDALELAALVAMTPLACWTCGVFRAVGNLDLL